MKTIWLGLSIVLIIFANLTASNVFGQNALHGVWKITKATHTTSDSSWTINQPQPGYYIFSEGYFSTVLVTGDKQRAELTAESSQEDILSAFNAFIANSGTYELDNEKLTVQLLVAKQPNAMISDYTFSYNYQLTGDMLTLTFKDVAWAQVGEEIKYQLARVE